MYQEITIAGNLGTDPELKYLDDGTPVCNFTVAVNEIRGSGDDRTEKTTWFRVSAWRKTAEIVSQYLSKGRRVLVVGTVSARAYIDKNGNPQASLDLVARDVRFLDRKSDVEATDNTPQSSDIPF